MKSLGFAQRFERHLSSRPEASPSTRGILIEKQLPTLSLLSIERSPPRRLLTFLLKASPSPVPPYLLAEVSPLRLNCSNIESNRSGAIPIPVSRTLITASSPVRPAAREAVTLMRPSRVNLIALSISCPRAPSSFAEIRLNRRQTRIAGNFKVEPVLTRQRAMPFADALYESLQIDRLEMDLHLPGFDLRELEDFIDELQKKMAGGVNLRNVGHGFRVAGFVHLLQEHLAIANHRVERRAQFMAEFGQKIALGRASSLSLLDCDPQRGRLGHVLAHLGAQFDLRRESIGVKQSHHGDVKRRRHGRNDAEALHRANRHRGDRVADDDIEVEEARQIDGEKR